MTNDNQQKKENIEAEDQKTFDEKAKQEQSDPQITELRGFVNPSEDLEPTLTDGTKSPDKDE